MELSRGNIVLVDLDPIKGSEQGKIRPGLIIQNNEGNKYSPTTIVAPITSKVFSKEFPTNVKISSKYLKSESTILLNQIRTIDKIRIIKKIGKVEGEIIKKVDLAIKASLDLN
ncbi:MAG TPA: type II toxin-antitoxin system PemK/MazF family toxin [Candidatus Nanoarchaeia archaeon]|nr:type II toxin-antitoxin system PemK/MazF family toxin [Candidatus Nanoarchaeia archaeon]